MLGGRHGLGRLARKFDDPLQDGPAQVGVGRPAIGACGFAPTGPLALGLAASRGPGHGFGLAGLQRPGIPKPVLSLLDFQSPASGQRPHRPGHCQGIGKPCQLAHFGWRLFEDFPLRR